MQEDFDPGLKAHVVRDDAGRVRTIRHSQEYWEASEGSPREAAFSYVRQFASVYEMPAPAVANIHVPATHLDPQPRDVEFRLDEETPNFDATTFGFDQTILNTPVWGAGLRVTVKHGPNRVVSSVNTSHDSIEVEMPPDEAITRFKRLFTAAEQSRARLAIGDVTEASSDSAGRRFLTSHFGVSAARRRKTIDAAGASLPTPRLIRGRFWVYQYDAEARVATSGKNRPEPASRGRRGRAANVGETGETGEQPPQFPEPELTLPLPAVDSRILDGAYYVVAEITFEAAVDQREHVTWQALVEITTNSVLYLRALSGDVDGKVFLQDPPTKTGNPALNSTSNNASLNPQQDQTLLYNLGPAVNNVQSLTGTYGRIAEVEGDVVAAPTKPTNQDFFYDTRTNDFAAVSAYFQVDRIFRTIADLGFTVSGPSGYFNNTTFPISIDHRCFTGAVINAHCVGNGMGGIGHVGYGVMDTTDLAHPLGRACDPRVSWHEVCGHGILYEFVNSANFGFSHSAGDSLSGIYFDPESHLWGVDGTPLGKPGDLRFTYVPWHPTLNRRFDRDTAAGWAWNGAFDDAGYGSEEILATTLFRVYRSIGGDSTDLGRRKFASRMMMYLILRGVQNLTPASNPAYARDFATSLMTVDDLNWTSEGIYGGAYGKVIRWSFELQGEYQAPLVTNGSAGDGTIVTRGKPPLQDVYIDDGRAGEYEYQPVHWNTTTIWNRRQPDGLSGHEEPVLNAINYAYVRIKNRGTQTATGVVVRGFHTKPGAGLLWPSDFDAFATAQINVGTVGANNTEEKVVGPFQWSPNINALGHDCMLMVVSSDADTSNVDKFTAGETIPEWRLVPNDNNVGQRNVLPVAGGGGMEGLLESFEGARIWVGNPNPRTSVFTVTAHLPDVLTKCGWRLTFEGIPGEPFTLRSGANREIVLRLEPGQDFGAEDVHATAERDITVVIRADDNVMGGMTYRLDPWLKHPFNRRRPVRPDCGDAATNLLDCLGLPGQHVKGAHVKEIIVGIRLRDDDC